MGIRTSRAAGRFGQFRAVAGHPWTRAVPALGIGIWFLWLLHGRLGGMDLTAMSALFFEIDNGRWILAAGLTGASFAAVAGYDVLGARAMGLRIPGRAAALSGATATALAQLIGLGLATGALVRWRMLGASRFTLMRTTAMTMLVTLGFLAAGAVFAALAVLLWPVPYPAVRPGAVTVLALASAVVLLSLWRPRTGWESHFHWPRIQIVLGFLLLAAIDLGAAALAFWALVPAGAGIGFATLLPVFLLATGAGIVAGTPGGAGPFELVLFSALPTVGEAHLLSAILGFRLVYFLAPGAAALLVLLRREIVGTVTGSIDAPLIPAQTARDLPPSLENWVQSAGRAEARLVQGGGFDLLRSPDRGTGFLVRETGNALVAFSDPLGAGTPRSAVRALMHEARERSIWPVIYKAGPETAAAARACGFQTHKIGEEAVLDPAIFTLEGGDMRGLRRKCRQAAATGLCIRQPSAAVLPLGEMTALSDLWVAARGGERGFSMGRFDPVFTDQHRYFLARHDGELVGFIGLWCTDGEWALDLMRFGDDGPQGLMQALIVAAIAAARTEGIARFSLSAVPFAGLDRPESWVEWLLGRVYHGYPHWHGAQGLRQFKQSFRPAWEPRYLATRGLPATVIGGLEIAREIRPVRARRRPLRFSRQKPARKSFRRVWYGAKGQSFP